MRYPENSNGHVELHEEQPRGWYIPEEVKLLYDDTAPDGTRLSERVLNAEEMMLISKLNALCKRKKGCTASNAWLAKWWGKTKDWVSKTIAKFEELKLIEIRFLPGNRRSIWTVFPGRQKSDRGSRKVREVSDKNQMATDIIDKTSKKRHMDGGSAPSACIVLGVSGESRSMRYARKYAQFTIKRRWFAGQRDSTRSGWAPKALKRWARDCDELVGQIGGFEDLKEAMQWYFSHWDDHQYVPRCYTFSSFCSNYTRIRNAMQRKKGERNGHVNGESDIRHKRMTVQEARDEGWSEKQIRESGLYNR